MGAFHFASEKNEAQRDWDLPEAPTLRDLTAPELEASSAGSQVVILEVWWAWGGGPFGEKAHLDKGRGEAPTEQVPRSVLNIVQNKQAPPAYPFPLLLTLIPRRDWQGLVLPPFYKFIYLFLAALVFVDVCGLSLVEASRGYSSLWCAGFSFLIAMASLVAEHRL